MASFDVEGPFLRFVAGPAVLLDVLGIDKAGVRITAVLLGPFVDDLDSFIEACDLSSDKLKENFHLTIHGYLEVWADRIELHKVVGALLGLSRSEGCLKSQSQRCLGLARSSGLQ
jgi:hypothetical protein